ncbi:MAG: methyltransferase domain-containing protein [Actinobacteria bacterium]|nr:methyltransferase domain-containing protein [Actinomycetota bacterium]
MLRERAFAAVYDAMLGPAERVFLAERRAQLVGEASGSVLEIGAGTGLNLEHYRLAEHLVAAEPSEAMRAKLAPKAGTCAVPVEFIAAGADDLPYPDAHFDTVVSTLVLCTVPKLPAALAEVFRVLRPGGELRFLEHVRGVGSLAEWQDRWLPLWKWFGVGCHPNRDTEAAIRAGGFEVEEIEHWDAPGPIGIVRPQIQGVARRPAG